MTRSSGRRDDSRDADHSPRHAMAAKDPIAVPVGNANGRPQGRGRAENTAGRT